MLLEFGQQPFFLKLVASNCQIVGNFFGYLVQGMLAVLAFSALVIKKVTDKEQRTWKHWSFDTSKQAIGSTAVHFGNVAISYYLLDTAVFTDPCVFYWVSFMVDSIAGTILNIVFVKLVEWLDIKYWHTSHLQSGYYGRPARWSTWAIQTLVWLVIGGVVKVILLYAVLIPAIGPLYAAGAWVMSPLKNHPKWELVVVMVIVPLIVDTLVFWNTDAWIMNTQHMPGQEIDDLNDEFSCLKSDTEKDAPTPPAPGTAVIIVDADTSKKAPLLAGSQSSDSSAPIDVAPATPATATATAGGASSSSSSSSSSGVAPGLGSGTAFVLRGGGKKSTAKRASSANKPSSSLLSASTPTHAATVVRSTSAAAAVTSHFFRAPVQKVRQTDYHRL